MIKLKGKAVFGGIVKGKISFFRRNEIIIKKYVVEDVDAELEKYKAAKEKAIVELQNLYETSLERLGKEDACIFLIQQMIIEDEDFNNGIGQGILKERLNADYAVVRTVKDFANRFCQVDSEVIKSRSADLKDVSDRLLKHILNIADKDFKIENGCIICSDELMPSEVVSFDKSKILAICTCEGSVTSHTSILAITMKIPAVVGVGRVLDKKYDGCEAIVDGYSGTVYIQPDEKTVKKLEKKQEKENHMNRLFHRLKSKL